MLQWAQSDIRQKAVQTDLNDRNEPLKLSFDRLARACLNVGVGRGAVRIDLNCAECGNNHFNLDEGVTDHAVVYCRDCGHRIGTIEDLKARVAAEVLKRSAAGEFE